ncbi:type IV pilus biogenesis protein PilM [Halalkalibacter alkaliphilus]|uniref:Pilus assembly protein PilM n=1 Tax=Halalkalibacter alkaliphilus TaxID=2917993 RepID=A0A9X2CTR1_9BACI|nr:pilus assembly protein PilM [Halalkalibacter alkaliphilus]MCL7748098.1 pilus assembly protein PilM [Halalkalibacter alkaliphilus]
MFNKKYSGIDFRDKKVTFATVKMDKHVPVLEDIYEASIEDQVIMSGTAMDIHQLSDTLRSYLHNNKLASRHVHIAIPTQNTLIRKIDTLPDLEEKDLAKIIRFQIGESIHLPFEDPIYDFVKTGSIQPVRNKLEEHEDFTLEEYNNRDVQTPRSEILFFATSRIVSEHLLDACEDAGYKTLTAEIRGLALQRLLLNVHPRWLRGTEMVIDVGEENVDIHIFHNELIVFSRTMAIETEEVTGYASTSAEEVLSFHMDSVEGEREIAATKDELSWNEDNYTTALMNEIQKAQNFYRYSLGERDSEFDRIIITGEHASKVFNSLKERLPMEVTRIDYSSIILNDDFNDDLLDTCSVAIGLALRTNEKPNKKKKQ